MQVPTVWPGYEMRVEGFKLSGTGGTALFGACIISMATAAFTSPSLRWLKALQCFVLRLQRGETISPTRNTALGIAESSLGTKALSSPTICGLGRRKAEKKGWTSFSGEKQYFPQHAKVHAHFPVLHKSTSNMCLS